MSIQTAPTYWLTCDGTIEDGTVCGAKSTDGQEFTGWMHLVHARDDARESDWKHHDGKDYCETHSLQFCCGDCGEPEGSSECVCEADSADVTP